VADGKALGFRAATNPPFKVVPQGIGNVKEDGVGDGRLVKRWVGE